MNVSERVINLVAEAAGVEVGVISAHTELWRDLRIGGDDMLELFLGLQKEFGVNLDGLDLGKYSPDENEVLLASCAEWVQKRLHLGSKPTYASMTVSDLVSAVEARSWSKRR